MRKNGKLKVSAVLVLVVLFLMSGMLFAKGPDNTSNPGVLYRTTDGAQPRSIINIGNWTYWLKQDGESAHTPQGDSGGIYPRGKAGMIYKDGLMWGAYLADPTTGDPIPNQPLRVGGGTYSLGTQAGKYEDNSVQGVFRIRPDYQTLTYAQVRQDAAEQNEITAGDVSDAQCQAIIDQYAADWENWPVEAGAPYYDVNGNGAYDEGYEEDLNGNGKIDLGEREEPGIALADQVAWFVVNDNDEALTTGLYGSNPMGMELQVTQWAYNLPDNNLGQVIFKKFVFINKSEYKYTDMYVGQWSDPDLGNYGDDLVGCDTTLSIGFLYNGNDADEQFAALNLAPPSAAYDFFQGPRVYTGNPEDTAVWNLDYISGYINLPMTSFIYFAAGSDITDPTLQQYEGTLQWYNLLRGYTPTDDVDNPTPYIAGSGPEKDSTTIFPLSGDPVNDPNGVDGDVDGRGSNLAAADRRFCLNSGPFEMEPGERQEVVVAVIGGLGGDRYSSISVMKQTDDVAQTIYNLLFKNIPKAPASPVLNAIPNEDYITLEWGSDPDAIAATEADNVELNYMFEGYNVYQLPSATAGKDEAVRIATFDLVNGVRYIRSFVFDTDYGDLIKVPIQYGSDSGIQRFIKIDRDYIGGTQLYQGKKYYFAVTAYNYNDVLDKDASLESALIPIEVIPQPELPGTTYGGDTGDDIVVSHDVGASDGQVVVTVVDPSKLTGADYRVFFTEVTDTNSAMFGEIVWSLERNGSVIVENQPQSLTVDEMDQLLIDGLLIQVAGPALNFNRCVQVADASGPIDEDNVWHSLSSTGDWFVSAGGGSGGFDRLERYITYAAPRDFEMRFTEGDHYAIYAFENDMVAGVTWEIWSTGIATPDDPSDDVRMIPFIYSNAGTSDSLGWATGTDGYFGLPCSDWIYWMDAEGTDGYDNFAANCASSGGPGAFYDFGTDTSTDGYWANFYGGFVYPIGRFVLGDYGIGTYPETGTVIRLITNKPIADNDEFSFSVPMTTMNDMADAKDQVKMINVFPNPYYAFNSESENRFRPFVTFNHLPTQATIRIFNLAGQQVRKLEKDDNTQFETWDLKNESGLPVGSGIYFAHIKLPELGKEKVLKVFIIQRAEMLEYF